jgi:hypothetical protein
MYWTSKQRAFAVEAYFSNVRSFIANQRAFRIRFCIRLSGQVPDQKSIVTWVNTFRARESVNARGSGGQRTATTPENVERVREAFQRSLHRYLLWTAQSPDFAACEYFMGLSYINWFQ